MNPCRNNGICSLAGLSQYKCTCQAGFTGTNCDSILNPCMTNNSPTCLNNGDCAVNLKLFPYFTCTCRLGYSGTRCQNTVLKHQPVCVDQDAFVCKIFSSSKYCTDTFFIKGITLLKYCAKSCNVCQSPTTTPRTPPICADTSSDCVSWAALNYCNLYPVFNLCKKSCSLC